MDNAKARSRVWDGVASGWVRVIWRPVNRNQRLILGVWTTPKREVEFGMVLPVVG
jgi:hypothetical protein